MPATSDRLNLQPPPDEPAAAESPAPSAKSPEEIDQQLAQLRDLLLGPERAELAELRRRLDDPTIRAEEVSRVLADAIRLRKHPDKDFSDALAPPLESAFKASVKKDPQQLVDAIAPVMGPAIRQAISDALARMIQSLNQTLENSVSRQGWRWRLEAYRTGKPFAEVVMLHSLLYRVEQVFLVHRSTGLLLQHISAGVVEEHDADLISGMLTAIRDFVRDSFGLRDGESLNNLRVGDLTVWVEQGSAAYMAVVIRGNAPEALRTTAQRALEQLHLKMQSPLEQFTGDTIAFESARPHLETCLLEARFSPEQAEPPVKLEKTPQQKLQRRLTAWVTVAMVSVLLIIPFGQHIIEVASWNAYLARLSAEPGIMVTAAERHGSAMSISGLRDPLSQDPATLAEQSEIDLAHLTAHWEPYVALSPAFVLSRARFALNPPSTVTFRLSGTTLIVHGWAPAAWVSDASIFAPLVPGITRLDASGMKPKSP